MVVRLTLINATLSDLLALTVSSVYFAHLDITRTLLSIVIALLPASFYTVGWSLLTRRIALSLVALVYLAGQLFNFAFHAP
jgi:hypothetical protein